MHRMRALVPPIIQRVANIAGQENGMKILETGIQVVGVDILHGCANFSFAKIVSLSNLSQERNFPGIKLFWFTKNSVYESTQN